MALIKKNKSAIKKIITLGGEENVVISGQDKIKMNVYVIHSGESPLKKYNVTINHNQSDCVINLRMISVVKNGAYEINLLTDHLVPKTKALVEIRRVLLGKSCGTINIQANLQNNSRGSESKIIDKALLSSSKAVAVSRPNLVIDNTKVKAFHSSNIGYFEDYITDFMQSKGLSKLKIHKLLVENFIKTGLDDCPSDIINTLLTNI